MNKYEMLNDYYDFFKNQKSFLLLHGTGNLLVSASHSVEQTRENVMKYGEPHTGAIALLLHDELKCPVIVKTHNHDGKDANYDGEHFECEYKTRVEKYVLENNIRFLLDLHLMGPHREEMIDIGTGKGLDPLNSNKVGNILGREDIVDDIIIKAFADRNFGLIKIDEPFDAVFPYTVSATIARKCAIPCFQIEMNSKLVLPDYPENRVVDVYETIRHIAETIMQERSDF